MSAIKLLAEARISVEADMNFCYAHGLDGVAKNVKDRLARIDALLATGGWMPMESAPKGGGAEFVTDPKWIDPPKMLMCFGDEGVSIAHWDWYYASGGSGFTDGFAWIEPFSGEPLNLHFTTPPTGWQPLPPLPEADK